MKSARQKLAALNLIGGLAVGSGCASNGVSYDVRSALTERHGCIGAATTPYLDVSEIERDIAGSRAKTDYRNNCLSGYSQYHPESIPGIKTNYDPQLNVVVAYRK